jgi:hypothetical protein
VAPYVKNLVTYFFIFLMAAVVVPLNVLGGMLTTLQAVG